MLALDDYVTFLTSESKVDTAIRTRREALKPDIHFRLEEVTR
jgi:hypothetical protein